jgi:hypothetical protein
MRRELGQLSLADGLAGGGAGRNRQLEQIAALVDWAASSACSARSTPRRSGGRRTGRWFSSNACCWRSGTDSRAPGSLVPWR